MALSADGRRALTSDPAQNGILHVWDVDKGEETQTFSHHKEPVQGVSVSADGSRSLSCSQSGGFCSDPNTGGAVGAGPGAGRQRQGPAALSADGRRAVYFDKTRNLQLWNLESMKNERGLGGWSDVAVCLAWSADGRVVLCGGASGGVWSVNVAGERVPWTFTG